MRTRQSCFIICTISVLALLLMPVHVWSVNLGGFKVSSFIPEKYDDFLWKVGGDFNLAGSDSESETEIALWFDGNESDNWTSSNSQYLRLNTNTIYLYETINRQFEIDANFDGNLTHSGTSSGRLSTRDFGDYIREDDQDRNRLNFGFNSRVTGLYRQYYGSTFFTQLSISGGSNRSNISNEDSYQSQVTREEIGDLIRTTQRVQDQANKNTEQSHRGTIELGFGVGHLWEGSFASNAMHIIDQLEKESLIKQEPTANQMHKLTRIIYEYKQANPIDSRLHRQEALRVIVEFLEDERITSDLTHQGHYLIQDIWSYYPSRREAPRLFGLRGSVTFGYKFTHTSSRIEYDQMSYLFVEEYDPANPSVRDTIDFQNDSSNREQRFFLHEEASYLRAKLEYHYPINHLWQFDATSQLDLQLNNSATTSIERRRRAKIYLAPWDRIATQFEASRIFDARTRVSCFLTTDFTFDHQDKQAILGDITYPAVRKVWYTNLKIQAGCNITYRLAIPTTLNIRVSFRFDNETRPGYTSDITHDTNNYSITAGLSHYLY